MVSAGNGGSIIITSSTSGLKGMSRGDARADAYTAAKHGLVGHDAGLRDRARTRRHPGQHDSPDRDAAPQWWRTPRWPRGSRPTCHAWPAGSVTRCTEGGSTCRTISDAVVFLASDRARSITGVALPVDAGFSIV